MNHNREKQQAKDSNYRVEGDEVWGRPLKSDTVLNKVVDDIPQVEDHEHDPYEVHEPSKSLGRGFAA